MSVIVIGNVAFKILERHAQQVGLVNRLHYIASYYASGKFMGKISMYRSSGINGVSGSWNLAVPILHKSEAGKVNWWSYKTSGVNGDTNTELSAELQAKLSEDASKNPAVNSSMTVLSNALVSHEIALWTAAHPLTLSIPGNENLQQRNPNLYAAAVRSDYLAEIAAKSFLHEFTKSIPPQDRHRILVDHDYLLNFKPPKTKFDHLHVITDGHIVRNLPLHFDSTYNRNTISISSHSNEPFTYRTLNGAANVELTQTGRDVQLNVNSGSVKLHRGDETELLKKGDSHVLVHGHKFSVNGLEYEYRTRHVE